MRKKRSAGFTLVELLVVIAIIGILVALLLPAVQAAREAARRMSCSNNLKQIVLSIHNYHDTHKAFPINHGGVIGNPWSNRGSGRSWFIGVMPYTELQTIYDDIVFDPPGVRMHTQNLAIARTQIKDWLCPSDGYNGRGVLNGRQSNALYAGNLTMGVANYKAVAGQNWQWGDYNWPRARGKWHLSGNGLDRGDGFICRNGDGQVNNFLSMSSILDGTSNTLAVGECIPDWCNHSWWWHFNGSTATCGNPLNYRRGQLSPGALSRARGDWPRNYSFFSNHPAGAQFARVDGSVDFVNDSINLAVYHDLASVRGGEQPRP